MKVIRFGYERAKIASLLGVAVLAFGCDDEGRAPPPHASPTPLVSATASASASALPIASAAPLVVEDAGHESAAEDASAPIASAAAPAPTASAAPSSPPKNDARAKVEDAGVRDAEAPIDAGSKTLVDASAALSPAAHSADAVAADVDTIFAGSPRFFAHFKQEHRQKVSGVIKTSTGTLFVHKPNRVSFRYDAPNDNRIVSDGTTFKLYVAEDKQMFTQPVEQTEYPGALSFIMGRGLLPSFSFTFNEKAKFDGGPVLLGKPRAETPHYDTVLFYIDETLRKKRDPGVIRRVLIVDAQGNRNRFDFEKCSQPDAIDPSEFVFSPPPGTAVKQGG